MIGIFSADDVRSYLYDETIWRVANAGDVMVSPVVTVTPADDLNTALTRFTSINVDELPVVEPDDSGKLLGMVRRKECIAAYNHRLIEHKQNVSANN
jgi:CIC family chloride channel protein